MASKTLGLQNSYSSQPSYLKNSSSFIDFRVFIKGSVTKERIVFCLFIGVVVLQCYAGASACEQQCTMVE
jgi:hypothetical protein